MRIGEDILGNYVLICSMAAWFTAQLLKIITGMIKYGRVDYRRVLFASGGMPSSHASTVSALCASIAVVEGFGSVAFALSFIFAFIVMYDATGVRRAAGEQAKILNQLVDNLSERRPDYFQKKLKELIGHTPLEVIAGALLGILVVLLIPT